MTRPRKSEPAAASRGRRKVATKAAGGALRVQLRPQNPFDLIRLLAQTQTEPRKAVAELVQNSLDAGAHHIELTWFNEKGRRALRLWDDGEGIFPELERQEALRRIARTIGHSHKLDMTPMQRRDQMVLGKYGIGLIGFWCVSEVMEVKSRVGGGPALVLRLREDQPQGEVFTSRSRLLDDPDTFTEICLRGVHENAQNRIRPPRLQAYLASELRGQLLERGARVIIHDRVARGLARKRFVVEPQPYLGRRLEEWQSLEVPGYEDARLELYAVAPQEARSGVVALSCGGAIVMDDLAYIDGDDAPRELWASGQLEGVIDFPELHVPPATRRGFVYDEPVAAFLAALAELERELSRHFELERERHAHRRREHLARDIRKAFSSVAQALPEYDFFTLRQPSAATAADAGPLRDEGLSGSPAASEESDGAAVERAAEGGAALAPTAGSPGASASERESQAPQPAHSPQTKAVTGEEDDSERDEPLPSEAPSLFPPGPLALLRVQPKKLWLTPLASRRLRARALDGDGRACAGTVEFLWHLSGGGQLSAEGAEAIYTAPEAESELARGAALEVLATQGDVAVQFAVPIRLRGAAGGAGGALLSAGIPEPRPVSAPGESWRSRMSGRRWEYNDAHRDFLAVADVEARRLRYLIHLFAKEIVLRNFGGPAQAELLERMVEVLTHLDASGRR